MAVACGALWLGGAGHGTGCPLALESARCVMAMWGCRTRCLGVSFHVLDLRLGCLSGASRTFWRWRPLAAGGGCSLRPLAFAALDSARAPLRWTRHAMIWQCGVVALAVAPPSVFSIGVVFVVVLFTGGTSRRWARWSGLALRDLAVMHGVVLSARSTGLLRCGLCRFGLHASWRLTPSSWDSATSEGLVRIC